MLFSSGISSYTFQNFTGPSVMREALEKQFCLLVSVPDFQLAIFRTKEVPDAQDKELQ
jgi:hypothetical protein